jgi:hypothetical protein
MSDTDLENLSESPVPRDRTVIDQWTRDVAKRTRKLARGIALWFIGAMLLSATVTFFAARSTNRPGDIEYALEISGLLMLFMGLLPSWAIRRILERDIRATKRLVRHGLAAQGRITAHQRLGYGGLHMIDVSWSENSRQVCGRFDIDKIELTGSERIVVLAIPKTKTVAAVFGDRGMFVGRRSKR